MTTDLVAAGHDNLRAAFAGLAAHGREGETRRFGSIAAVSSGIPVPMFNRVFVFEPPDDDALRAAVSWIADRELPFWVTVPSSVIDDVAPLAAELGLEAGEAPQPGMALASLDEIPPTEPVADVAEVTSTDGLETFEAISGAVFGLPEAVRHEMMPESILTDDTLRPFVGRVRGESVACGLLVRSDDVAGVYTIGVHEAFRNRGIGEAMTWAVLRAGRADGCRLGVLQSSEMGYSVYERMGFETVVEYHNFEPVG